MKKVVSLVGVGAMVFSLSLGPVWAQQSTTPGAKTEAAQPIAQGEKTVAKPTADKPAVTTPKPGEAAPVAKDVAATPSEKTVAKPAPDKPAVMAPKTGEAAPAHKDAASATGHHTVAKPATDKGAVTAPKTGEAAPATSPAPKQ